MSDHSKHSPLPWHNSGSSNRSKVEIADANWDTIFRVDWSLLPQEHDEANADYIVKACNAYPKLVEALKDFRANVHIPEKNCSCHIAPPCHDCVENGGIRETDEWAEKILRELGELP